MATYPSDRRYTKDHEWALEEDGLVSVSGKTMVVYGTR